MGPDVTLPPFILGKVPTSDSDPYFGPRPETTTNASSSEPWSEKPIAQPKISNPSKNSAVLQGEYESYDRSSGNRYTEDDLLYHVDRITGVYQLCIPPAVATDIIAIAHGEGHPGFAHCREIVSRSWFIKGLTRLLRVYIQQCPNCLALQTRRHLPYRSLQPIQSPPVLFFTLTLDFILALSLSPKGYNALMSVTCKFSKRITLVPGKDTWSVADLGLCLASPPQSY